MPPARIKIGCETRRQVDGGEFGRCRQGNPSLVKKLLREPLLHFLALGAALFALHAWRAPQKSSGAETPRIEVNAAMIERLRAGHERQFGRAPDEDELRGLVAAHIREEVLYREALAMGLDRDDTIVRRRMAQKMEFLTDDVVGGAEPDEAALQRFFAQNASHYAKPARVSFRHVYFSHAKRGANSDVAAKEALAALRGGASDQALGDGFLHGLEFSDQEAAEIAAMFGQEFSEKIATLREGEWSEPIPSSYGLHLARVEKRGEARAVSLEEVRDTVARDFNGERRRAANREVFEKLRERYHVTVDEDAVAKAVSRRTALR